MLGLRQLSQDAVPMPTQVSWSPQAASEVQQHATVTGLGQSEFHRVGFVRRFFASMFCACQLPEYEEPV